MAYVQLKHAFTMWTHDYKRLMGLQQGLLRIYENDILQKTQCQFH
jgi:hypothetical protein